MNIQLQGLVLGLLAFWVPVGALLLCAMRQRDAKKNQRATENAQGKGSSAGGSKQSEQRDADDQSAQHCCRSLGSEVDGNVA